MFKLEKTNFSIISIIVAVFIIFNHFSNCDGDEVNNGTCDDQCCKFFCFIELLFFWVSLIVIDSSKNNRYRNKYEIRTCLCLTVDVMVISNAIKTLPTRPNYQRRLDRLGKLEYM